MGSSTPKLMTKGKLILCIVAVLFGSSLSLIREFRATGTVITQSIVISVITFCVGLAIVSAVGWWVNRPKSGGSNE